MIYTLQKQNQIQIWHYIFVGELTEEIKEILEIIEDFDSFELDDEDPIGEENITILNNFFKYDVLTEWQVKNIIEKKYNKVIFIPHTIHINQNINVLKHIITECIQTNNPLQELMYPEHQCITTYLKNYNSIENILYKI